MSEPKNPFLQHLLLQCALPLNGHLPLNLKSPKAKKSYSVEVITPNGNPLLRYIKNSGKYCVSTSTSSRHRNGTKGEVKNSRSTRPMFNFPIRKERQQKVKGGLTQEQVIQPNSKQLKNFLFCFISMRNHGKGCCCPKQEQTTTTDPVPKMYPST